MPEVKEEIPEPAEENKEEVSEEPAAEQQAVDESAEEFVKQLFGGAEAVNEASVAEEEEEIIEEVPVSEFYFGEGPAEISFEHGAVTVEPTKEEKPEQAPVEPAKEEKAEQAPVEDDSWLKEVRMDDIDLDIQEDDDE